MTRYTAEQIKRAYYVFQAVGGSWAICRLVDDRNRDVPSLRGELVSSMYPSYELATAALDLACQSVARNQPSDPDLRLEFHGSLWLVDLNTDAAREWWSEQVQEGMDWGNKMVVEQRYIDAIAEGARQAGLVVRP